MRLYLCFSYLPFIYIQLFILKLKTEFPGLRFALPPKRWFGDNFDPVFLEDRQIGLQTFIDNIIGMSACDFDNVFFYSFIVNIQFSVINEVKPN